MAALLFAYFLSALCYSVFCGLLGKDYHPLIAFTVYALALTPGLIVALISGRLTQLWQWRRLWPPTQDETLAAVSSTIILTASTLMLLSPQSLIAIFFSQAGCLLLVARRSSPASMLVAVLSMIAVGLSIFHKPLLVAALPICLGAFKTFGYFIKIRSVNRTKAPAVTAAGGNSPEDFLATEQVLISVLALAVAGIFSIAALQLNLHPASNTSFILDWRLWAMSAASLGMGLLGTGIMLRKEATSFTFPAYRMMSLLAALGAAWARGELRLEVKYWSNWSAALLACIVILIAGHSAKASLSAPAQPQPAR